MGVRGEGGLVEEANWLMKWPEKEYWKKKIDNDNKDDNDAEKKK